VQRKARDSNPQPCEGARISGAARRTVSGYLPSGPCSPTMETMGIEPIADCLQGILATLGTCAPIWIARHFAALGSTSFTGLTHKRRFGCPCLLVRLVNQSALSSASSTGRRGRTFTASFKGWRPALSRSPHIKSVLWESNPPRWFGRPEPLPLGQGHKKLRRRDSNPDYLVNSQARYPYNTSQMLAVKWTQETRGKFGGNAEKRQ
jgi:hypothetical protein